MSEPTRPDAFDATQSEQPDPADSRRDTAPGTERSDPGDGTSRDAHWQFSLEGDERRSSPFSLRQAPPLVKAFLISGLVVAGAAIAAFLLDADVAFLKTGEEGNLPTWYSASQLFTIGLVLSAIAFRDAGGSSLRSRALVAVPALFLFLSLDEAATIHENLGAWLQTLGIGTDMRTAPWMFIYVPLIGLLGAVALWAFWPYLRGRRDILVLAGLGVALFGFSAVGLEFVSNFAADGGFQQKGLGFAEEYGEMLAASLLLWGSVLVTRAEGIRIELGRGRNTSADPQRTPGQEPQHATSR